MDGVGYDLRLLLFKKDLRLENYTVNVPKRTGVYTSDHICH